MTPNPDEVVRVAKGELVDTEMYQLALKEAGIESKVVGQDLDASFGSALLDSMELYVHARDAERALEIIRKLEESKGKPDKPASPPHGRPGSERRPG
jgi:hypothetical protein